MCIFVFVFVDVYLRQCSVVRLFVCLFICSLQFEGSVLLPKILFVDLELIIFHIST